MQCNHQLNFWTISLLWFNFILGLIFISLCFKLIIIYYHAQKQREIKIKPRIKLNHNITKDLWTEISIIGFSVSPFLDCNVYGDNASTSRTLGQKLSKVSYRFDYLLKLCFLNRCALLTIYPHTKPLTLAKNNSIINNSGIYPTVDYEQSLFILGPSSETRATEGARRERHEIRETLFCLLGLPPSFLASRSTLARVHFPP